MPLVTTRAKNSTQFAMTDHRFAADQRNVHRLVFADEIEDAIDERVAAKVA